VQGNTLAKELWENVDIEYDKFCNSRNLEWLLTKSEDIVVTGVMMRALKGNPETWIKSKISAMKQHMGWDDANGEPTRSRNYGGVDPGKAVAWEYNNNPSAEQTTLARGDDVKWVRYDDDRSAVIEDAYQSFQRFVFIGKPDGAEGPYFIDFGQLCDEDLVPMHGQNGPEQRRADSDRAQGWRRRAVRRVKE